ncbi:MAG: PocR ligand-binding domain-containing protein [Deltaproteobacteria bacterium]|nr:PocR ligand-binding domain-containing protein [Deltaproteobacteria bacterium]MBW2199294.1 PocR ligand-binding domain-containing protein [Deltaproteobacteria bacterium]MBW2540236.1 PocR ligand-binding domain-containing protein [Deltaproteobacteria bacterium]
MGVYDIRSPEEWQKILDDVCQASGMPAALVDAKSVVLQSSGKRCPLCAKIRSINESLSFICAQTQQFMVETSRTSRRPVIDACEAGMLKFLIPLFLDGEFTGSVTVCGCSFPGEEIEVFGISQVTKMKEDEIISLVKQVPEIEQAKVDEIVDRLFQKLKSEGHGQ